MTLKKIIFSTKHQLIILVLIAIGLNLNSLFNEYALDDEIVLTKNSFVEKGIKGIPDIITTDLMKGFVKQKSILSQPRYRPFVLVIFAIEYQFFGANPMISHLINILLFVLLITLLFKLLQASVFREQNNYLAFITCLLFVVHPVHTEVIANVKSRDELITFLLLIGSFITFIKYIEKQKPYFLFIGLFCFLIALLTRESAVTFVGVVPLLLYFFFNQTLKKSIQFSIPLIFVFLGYLALRYLVVGLNYSNTIGIENDPFLFATASQAFATKVFILFKYVLLLIVPHPLSWEYGYNQIPYIEVYSYQFFLSLLLIIGLIVYAILGFKKKSIFSFCILYFIVTISLAANFFVDIGTPFSERLLFQPSLAFCIAVAALYIKINEKKKVLATAAFFLILLLFSVKTYYRNGTWKNNETLFLADVNSSPNSLRTNSAASNIYLSKGYFETNIELKKDFLKKSIYYAERTLKIYPNHQRAHNYLVSAFRGLFDSYKTVGLFLKDNDFSTSNSEVKRIIEDLSDALYKQGNGFYEQNNFDKAIECYLKSVELNNNQIEAWYNLGGNYFLKNDTINAMKAWGKVKMLDSNHPLKKEEFLTY